MTSAPCLLVSLIGVLRGLGVTLKQVADACERIPAVGWRRLPLFTGAIFDGGLVQDRIKVETEVDFEEFIGVYEEFIAGFMLTDTYRGAGLLSWLGERLNLKPTEINHLFAQPGHGRGRPHYTDHDMLSAALALAALAAYTYPGAKVENTPTSFLVTLAGYTMGVSDGRVYQNLGKKPGLSRRFLNIACAEGLCNWGRTEVIPPLQSSTSTIYNRLLAWSLVTELEDQVGFELALTLLRHQTRGKEFAELEGCLAVEVDRTSLEQAVRLASGFEHFTDPYREIKELLVPAFLSHEDFREGFGKAPPSARMFQVRAERWRASLDKLLNA